MPAKKKTARSPPKTFRCETIEGCDMVFTRSEHLARHIRKHTGDKPYSCPFPTCGRNFSRYDNMMQHQQTHFRTKKPAAPRKPTAAARKRAAAAAKKAQAALEAQQKKEADAAAAADADADADATCSCTDEASPPPPSALPAGPDPYYMGPNEHCHPLYHPMSGPNRILPPIHHILGYHEYIYPSRQIPVFHPSGDPYYLHGGLPSLASLFPRPITHQRPYWVESSAPPHEHLLGYDRRYSQPELYSRRMSWQYTPDRRSSAYSFQSSALGQLPLGRRLSSNDLSKPIVSLSVALMGDACLSEEEEEPATNGEVVVSTDEYQALEGMSRLSVSQPVHS
ncbi:C2H2-type zinc finger transcription factor [Phycomyces blakesleeanus]|uniref:C2H2-type zinc finger transcription factor n=2 Tax=Phycomyces blakesleeanus TaxID=4837 RepID=A0A162Y133_PHYB8|nr:C2H2-type zinc finger transcription factor [Phycomyces blakesleeanus NRRL 1555(-)]OAD77795.1 C2H2-type zinc finger transcription factor [Phycomyces blakesleeanus NRRL 1555(-)]|eukprot:XP_018295835.1 C2H2-type zinc finger transcription factor [Phycomyces blakesleeanus NRRL 1555(-)]